MVITAWQVSHSAAIAVQHGLSGFASTSTCSRSMHLLKLSSYQQPQKQDIGSLQSTPEVVGDGQPRLRVTVTFRLTLRPHPNWGFASGPISQSSLSSLMQ